jgi:hypothetical protein
MRGTRAKDLRRAVRDSHYTPRFQPTGYVEVPRTARIKVVPTGRFRTNAEGEQVEITFQCRTVTIALAPDCERHYTQRLKRAYQRGVRA